MGGAPIIMIMIIIMIMVIIMIIIVIIIIIIITIIIVVVKWGDQLARISSQLVDLSRESSSQGPQNSPPFQPASRRRHGLFVPGSGRGAGHGGCGDIRPGRYQRGGAR
jgi:hypothetical protein